MVVVRSLLLVVLLAASASPASAQTEDPAVDAGMNRLVAKLEQIMRAGGRDDLAAISAPQLAPDVLSRFAEDFFIADIRRAVVHERDRTPLLGALPGDGFSLIVEFFAEVADHGRLMTARVDARRPRDGDVDSWRIVDVERLSLVEGLYRLKMNQNAAPVRNFAIEAENLQLTLADGFAFPIDTDRGVTGLVLLGRGEMKFAPPSPTERGQLRIFSGATSLVTPFDAAFIRLNPDDYQERVASQMALPAPVDARTLRRAQELATENAPKSFNLDLSDLSSDQWYLLPPPGDFLSEVRTRRFGLLTYSRNQKQAEDVTLFDRARRRTISLYASEQKLAESGPTYNEDDLTDFDITAYDIDARLDPERQFIEARARVTLRSRVDFLATVTLRLADSLDVRAVTSPQFGRLLFLRIRNQNAVLVDLPAALDKNAEITLTVSYAGPIESQRLDSESIVLEQIQQDEAPYIPLEPSFLLSNRAFWYPQNSVSDYATARLRIALPEGWNCVASGQRLVGTDTTLRDLLGPIGAGRFVAFAATEPVRYLAVVAGRFARVSDATVSVTHDAPGGGVTPTPPQASTSALSVDASARQQGRGREVARSAEDIMRFYASLLRDLPYRSTAVTMVEAELPGGHSPAYAVMLNSPAPTTQFTWRNDPAAFLNFPDFFLAHELAHQWWGQAVGWKNYHEQWLSESFAQYFAALYAQQSRGDAVFGDMLRQFRRWALAESDQGPVYLGYRLGHVKNESRVFRALVYNKGAGVLHMLRRFVGDDAFFRGLRRFYMEQRFRKAGTDDLQRAMEAESGKQLGRFFERWIYGADIPHLRYTTQVSPTEVVVRFEQLGPELFDVPVTVSITQANGRVLDVVVPVTAQQIEHRIPVTGGVRQVQVNRDAAALAEFN